SVHGSYGAGDVFQVRADVPSLPVSVVRWMGEEFAPDGRPAFEVNRLRVRQRAHPQVEVVTVGRFEVETLQLLVQRVLNTLGKPVEKIEVLREEKSAVVMEVVAHE